MVTDTASLVPNLIGAGGTAISVITYVIIGVAVLAVLAILGLIWYLKKSWNLDVEFKLTRNDGRITNAEWGKGHYDSKKGVVYVKRPGDGKFARGTPIKIFDIRRYIQGDRIITVLQVGPQDFRPVLNDSWTMSVHERENENGEIEEVKESILNIKVDSGLNKAWKSAWDSAAKNAYSITTLLQQYQTPISIGIVVICCFVGFAILWTKVA